MVAILIIFQASSTPHYVSKYCEKSQCFRFKSRGHHTTYGKIDSLDKSTKLNTSSRLLIRTVPTRVRIIEPYLVDFSTHSQKFESIDFIEISLSEIAFITEIIVN